MRIVLLGAPGSGKGTQSALIQDAYDIPQVSTGDILRAAVADGTPVGVKAKGFMSAGKLVPDDVILELVEHRLAQSDAAKGFILDGFPRTIAQAEGLEELIGRRKIALDYVIKIDVPKQDILKRMTSRRVCSNCNAVYNMLSKPPQRDGVCDQCGEAAIVQREDDTEDTVRRRLQIYEADTRPLIDYYDQKGLLHIVDGSRAVELVFQEIQEHLG